MQLSEVMYQIPVPVRAEFFLWNTGLCNLNIFSHVHEQDFL
jgi:hypothetical protein